MKYIINTDDFKFMPKTIVVMGVAGCVSKSIDDLEELNADYINEHFSDLQDTAYQRGLEEGKKATFGLVADASSAEYQRGLEDGKAQSERGCEGCRFEGNPHDNPCKCCSNGYPNQWTAKDDKIEVGDEVTDIQSGANFLVTHLWESNHGDKGVSGFNNDCSAFSTTLDKVSKTGRHFDIASILKEMQSQ